MNSTDNIFTDSVARVFETLCTDAFLHSAEQGEWLAGHWQTIEDLGLPSALLSEEAGGFGMERSQSLELLKLAGYFAVPLPLAETMLANMRLAEAGFKVGAGVSVIALPCESKPLNLVRQSAGWSLTGEVPNVSWGRRADRAGIPCRYRDELLLVEVPRDAWRVVPRQALDGSPLDNLLLDVSLPDEAVMHCTRGLDTFIADDAAIQVLLMAGALRRVLELTVQYAGERAQFGKPLAKFQIIQQNLALLASQTCAAYAAADLVIRALSDDRGLMPVAIAKSRAGEAASICCGLAHQLHGAMGFTAEHRLHFFTKLLWTCRDRGGNEAYWSRCIGQQLAQVEAEQLWPYLSSL